MGMHHAPPGAIMGTTLDISYATMTTGIANNAGDKNCDIGVRADSTV